MRILYVEDSQLDVDMTRRALNKSRPDFIIDTVTTQRDALSTLEKNSGYDLVLTNMRLPDGSGLAILNHIRGRNLPLAVVIITGQEGNEETAVAVLKAGANDYVVKREGYLTNLPTMLESALQYYHQQAIRQSHTLRVLYAEPNAADVDLARRHMTNFAPHIQLDAVGNAFEIFQRLSDYPDDTYQVILLDYRLQGMNALEILKELRQVHKLELPIVLITGRGGEEVAVQAMQLGAVDYVVKNTGYICKLPAILENAFYRSQLAYEHRVVARLKRQNELILNSVGEGIVGLDLDGNHTFVNPAASRMLGYEAAEMIGLHTHCLWHHIRSDGSHFHEDECPIYVACREGLTLQNQEDLFWRKDNSCLPVEFSLLPICEGNRKLGSVLTFRDITERRRLESNLQEALETHRLLATHVDSMYLVDRAGIFLFINEGHLKRFGVSLNEVIGKRYSDFHSQEDARRFAENVAEVCETGQPSMKEHQSERDGRYFLRTLSPVMGRSADGKALQVAVISKDITEIKQAEKKLHETLDSLMRAVHTTIKVMASAVEARDPYTSGHQIRTANLACTIATEMGLPADTIEGLRMASIVHDIGKLSIPAEILSKPTKLSEIEFALIKEHVWSGYEMLKEIESPWPLAEIVRQHHERADGSGYPRNLKGEEICIEARILIVSDVVEAMASHRPYRASLGIEAALAEIEKNSGRLYDAAVADVCLRLFREKGFQLERIRF